MDFTRRLVKKRSKLRGFNMDMMLEAYLTHESRNLDTEDIPRTKEPVYILGKQYNAINDLEDIRKDIQSRLWFSYRKGFVQIGDSGLTSDKGWGCMLRCGQMLIGQALLFLHLGRDWRWTAQCRERTYLRILRMFEDRRTAPYSIHQIALMGASEGKQVGEWFGPNTVAQVLRKLSAYDEWSSIAFHVALDNTVVISDVRRICTEGPRPGELRRKPRAWKPLVLVIPLRLGITDINPVYVPAIKASFTFKQSLGLIGGKPNHALYFIGCVGNDVIFLDPHTTQSIGVVDGKEHEHERKMDSSYHCNQASRLPIMQMDPSVAVSFYCETEAEFEDLCEQIRRQMVTQEQQALIELLDEPQERWTPLDDTAADALGATALSWTHLKFDKNKFDFRVPVYQDRQFDDSDDDFELLG